MRNPSLYDLLKKSIFICIREEGLYVDHVLKNTFEAVHTVKGLMLCTESLPFLFRFYFVWEFPCLASPSPHLFKSHQTSIDAKKKRKLRGVDFFSLQSTYSNYWNSNT